MSDIRQRIIEKAYQTGAAIKAEQGKPSPLYPTSESDQRILLAAAREMAILIRERIDGGIESGKLPREAGEASVIIDDLVASLVSEEEQKTDDLSRSDQPQPSSCDADPRVDPSGGSWQPIKTAPKDGTNVMLWCVDLVGGNGRVATGSWHDTFNGSWWDWGMEYTLNPTHWMPIPSPPETP